jgi:hypothetical protein
MLLRPALGRFGDVGTQLFGQRPVMLGARSELVAVRNDFALDTRCAHAAVTSVSRKILPIA